MELQQIQEAWQRSIIPAVPIPIGSLLRQAHPVSLDADTLVVEFPSTASFHRSRAEDPKNATVLRDALYEVTGRKLALQFELGDEVGHEPEEDTPVSEEEILQLMKDTFDAKEVDE